MKIDAAFTKVREKITYVFLGSLGISLLVRLVSFVIILRKWFLTLLSVLWQVVRRLLYLFEKDKVEWDEGLLINGRASLETLVRVGMGNGRDRPD